MQPDPKTIMIMAGGTGGHVFPALAVAEYLTKQDIEIKWLGTNQGIEQRIVPAQGYSLFTVSVSGLRGKGLAKWVWAPFRLVRALLESIILMIREKPNVVLGMGGFASGPGGIAARLLGIPLLIHEQNAVAGTTNRLLAPLACKVMEAFPGTFIDKADVILTGNPVRKDILQSYRPGKRLNCETNPDLHLLVLGGSQGAVKLNHIIPETISKLDDTQKPKIIHQTGEKHFASTRDKYEAHKVTAKILPFIEDMAEVYQWADIVICRAGAMTIAELSAVGVGSILVPFPYAIDDHQTANAHYLSDNHAAILIPEDELTSERLAEVIIELDQTRSKVIEMADRAHDLSRADATVRVASLCMEYVNA